MVENGNISQMSDILHVGRTVCGAIVACAELTVELLVSAGLNTKRVGGREACLASPVLLGHLASKGPRALSVRLDKLVLPASRTKSREPLVCLVTRAKGGRKGRLDRLVKMLKPRAPSIVHGNSGMHGKTAHAHVPVGGKGENAQSVSMRKMAVTNVKGKDGRCGRVMSSIAQQL